MKAGISGAFSLQLKSLRETAGFTQEELATIAGLSVHAVSALERGERRRPHVETVRALAAALDLTGPARDALLSSARAPAAVGAAEQLSGPTLPLALTPLVGRAAEVQTLRQWIADPAARLITLTGPGGVGKTRLALEIAKGVAAETATRVVFVSLAAIDTPAMVAPAIADALGLTDVTAPDLRVHVSKACSDRPLLLVLDNFEQVLGAASLLVELLSAAAPLRLLTTSRAALHVRGEREYVVGPLAIAGDAEEQPPADLARSPAVRLFVERVRDVQPEFRLTATTGPIVAAICRRLDALPLALELAAPWMKALTPEDLLHRLAEDVLFAPVGARDLPERQQTINATVAWSYHLLSAGEQRVFRRLGALPGRFPMEAAASVIAGRERSPAACDQALAGVAALIDRSLLLRVDGSVPGRPLYQMLETVRGYAALELNAAGERDDALEGMARYCAIQATRAGEGLLGRSQLEWLNRLRDDLDIYRSTLGWLIERGRTHEAGEIAANLMFFWAIRGYGNEGLRWYERILQDRSLAPAAEARLLVGSAMLRYTLGDLEEARRALWRARELASDAGDACAVVQAENLLGHVEHAVGNVTAARDLFARSVENFRALSIPWGAGNALAGGAWVALATGDFGTADRLLDESAVVLEQAGPWFLLLTLYVRAVLEIRRGRSGRALGLIRESLTRIRELQDKFAFVYSLVPLAAAAVLEGQDAWAARILGVRDAVTERTGATVVDESVRDLRHHAERGAQARLGPSRWTRAYLAGRRASIESLLKDIDRLAPPRY